MHPGCSIDQVYLCREPIDFRKAITGLSVLVEQDLGLSPFASALYVFTLTASATKSKRCTGTATDFVCGKSVWRPINSPGRLIPKRPQRPSVCRSLDGC